ncbi:alpha-L-fucosidase [Zobellia galactanivorans]|uniref:alpha-L-fucosidase n=1 Tax=Zobellia galactanivorans (strain DSM 12802 / CCUG 47099 / CIP 106680 / NCIMB 13871 / Dsij) TaxID=63186 RepID=UPI0026E1E9F6|nr:alpha-L-fucosidase [Zobellia galactanivorans]MDO6809837.1 alpha-L-fucosidase [Zobellia galactanivorans]
MKIVKIVALFLIATHIQAQTTIDKKSKPLPELQLDFVNTRYQAYFHYNMATFNNVNSEEKQGRAYGKVAPTTWAPTGLDTDQWAQVVKDARMTGGWLTTKHHGGFCLWDSAYTDYDVASSGVKTDVVKAFVDSFRKAGLKVGLYYSILDYHHKVENGSTSRAEIEFTKNQIRELLTNYGPIDYINFDGWSSWPTNPDFDDMPYGEIYALVKSLQPNCLIVNHTYESNLAHAEVPFADAAGRAYPYHKDYMRPTAASDFIQRGWWWDNNNGFGVSKSVDYLLKQLNSYNSHNSVYILNISPNPEGRIDEDVITRLKETAVVWQKPAPLKKPGSDWGFSYEVSENLAFLKPCSQSTTHPYINDKRAYPRADIAVDGVTEGNWEMEQTSGTKQQMNPWWMVDFQDTEKINEITIYNATGQEKTEMTDVIVSILDKDEKVVWSKGFKEFPDPSKTLKTKGVFGRFVKIRMQKEGSLRIAEVIVK